MKLQPGRYYWNGQDWVPRRPPSPGVGANVIPDIEPCKNMVEGGMLTSRSQIRDLERRTGSRQVGNDWTGRIPQPEGFYRRS